MTTPLPLGVNYWPRGSARSWWNEFTAGEVREAYRRIMDQARRNLDATRRTCSVANPQGAVPGAH